ncbi:peptidylprolyl isomerase [Anaerocolumna xylanovorans]|uniref:Peptidyl-prolyl cis-trans isomerase n=1 Tax=Anaerocolumna xylanovorans DSM 12503 TaxID=1121345 RepID=A0A1M7YFD4_9FIRM|nr:peptidylprolyl isomerase [Anaerocolumna xylanovorans]SHO51357.1 peptidyl-prolyl cis-trans isomerase B (cyclophilin B) [Anaerocolumna xylanovorans DSM 12503]
MKKNQATILVILILLIGAVGVGFAIKNGKSAGSSAVSGYEDQLAAPQKGDTVAEIVVKGFGSIHVKFFQKEAPKAVENFTTHAEKGYYNGLTFHRIIDNFMIQGGDPTGTGAGGDSIWGGAFEDEFSDNLQPYRGALCMANSGANTNGSQFFIVQDKDTYDEATLSNLEQQTGNKFNKDAIEGYGKVGGTPWLYRAHTVFGQVYEGLDILDSIAATKADENGRPATDVEIEKITVSKYGE